VARHTFQACPVWIYTQSNITSILFTWVHYTNTANIRILNVKKVFRKVKTRSWCIRACMLNDQKTDWISDRPVGVWLFACGFLQGFVSGPLSPCTHPHLGKAKQDCLLINTLFDWLILCNLLTIDEWSSGESKV
jgi:hypothetical protein